VEGDGRSVHLHNIKETFRLKKRLVFQVILNLCWDYEVNLMALKLHFNAVGKHFSAAEFLVPKVGI
jgi:hypothetical protein